MKYTSLAQVNALDARIRALKQLKDAVTMRRNGVFYEVRDKKKSTGYGIGLDTEFTIAAEFRIDFYLEFIQAEIIEAEGRLKQLGVDLF